MTDMMRCARTTFVLLVLGAIPAIALAGSIEDLDGSTVLLERDDVKLRVTDLRAGIAAAPEEIRKELRSGASSKHLVRLIETMWIYKSISHRAEEAGLLQDPLVSALVERARDRALAKAYFKHLVETGKQPDWEQLAREEYVVSKASEPEERVKVAHILISTDGRTEEEAKARANEVYEKATRDEANFSELAKEYSDDKVSRVQGGRLGFVRKGQTASAFQKAAFELEDKGDVSEPVKTQFGYHVIKLLDRDRKPKSFEAFKEEIVPKLKERHRKDVRRRAVAKAQSKEGISFNDEALGTLLGKDEGSVLQGGNSGKAGASSAAQQHSSEPRDAEAANQGG